MHNVCNEVCVLVNLTGTYVELHSYDINEYTYSYGGICTRMYVK